LKPVHKERVAEHLKKRRRERKGDPEIHAVIQKVFEDTNEREIGFYDCLIQPSFFKMMLMLRMTDIGEMGMEDQEEIPLCF